jgi:hypothetical protein
MVGWGGGSVVRSAGRNSGKKHVYPVNSKKKTASSHVERMNWGKWLEHWETQNAIVAEVKPPMCGIFGCDEKVKVQGKWKCTACGKLTDPVT